MQHDPVKCRILRVTVTIPVCDVHVQFDISLEQLFSIHSERGMNEIGAGLAIPESELDDLYKGTGNSPESGSKRAGVPHGLPFELGPLFGEITGRLTQEWRHLGAHLVVNGLVQETE